MRLRAELRTACMVAATVLAATSSGLQAQTLRIAMTTSDTPTPGGIPDNGSEGGRFVGYPIYDALVNWDLTSTDKFADLTPGLATEWHIDPDDHTRWIFTLREGVRYHDGTLFKADDVVWNFDRHLNDKAANYDSAQASSYRAYTAAVVRYEKIDDSHVALYTARPFSMLPYLISRVFMVSPTQYKKIGNWQDFQKAPAGTGPFKVERVIPRTSIELSRNEGYWDKDRIPKLQKVILLPIPDANTRIAALRSGQVDWVEYPAPDSIQSLKAASFQIVTAPYPHVWAWQMNDRDNAVFKDKRVRLALNYGIDRAGLVELLAGTAVPSRGPWPDTYKYFGHPHERLDYDPDKARALLKDAGFGPGGKQLKIKVQVPTAGSGNMIPVPMAEFVQQSLKEIGVDVEYQVVDWGTMLTALRQKPDYAGASLDAINHGLPISDPTQLDLNFNGAPPPANANNYGSNWSHYKNDQVDALLAKAFETFDPAPRDALIAQAHALIVDDAPWLFVVHDLNPRALSPKVKGFRQAQSWYQDLTQLTVVP